VSLSLRHVGKRFGGLAAVHDVSFDVPDRCIFGLIGPNGAGKTTLFNLVTGVYACDEGTITFAGHDLTRQKPADIARAGVARTFQNIRLVGDATVFDNVIAGFHRHEKTGVLANLLGLPSALRERRGFEEKAHVLLDRFGMSALAKYPAGSLSYGHQRRIEMMRALAMDPAVLLLDEPVAGMNDAESYALADIFRAVARQGVAILLIEHNMRFVMSLCEHIYVLASGRLIAEGDPDSVGRHPRVIEAYLGA
jgi:branched-chain amino acid transport system ATP-binding protein